MHMLSPNKLQDGSSASSSASASFSVRRLLVATTDTNSIMADTDLFLQQMAHLSDVTNITQLRTEVMAGGGGGGGGDVTAFVRGKLGQVETLLQGLETLAAELGPDNHTLTADVLSRAAGLVLATERVGGVALRLMTSTNMYVSGSGSGSTSGSGATSGSAVEMVIVKQRSAEFSGFVFESRRGALPVYITVPTEAARAEMAGVIAFSLQAAPRVLSDGSAASGRVVTPAVVCSLLDAAGRALPVRTFDPVTYILGHGGTLPDKANDEVAECSFMTTSPDGAFRGWSSESCWMGSHSQTEVVCRCKHLTAFAVVYKTVGVQVAVLSITMIAWGSCAFTAMAALVTVLTMIGYGLLDTDRSFVRINLLVALGMSESLFLAGTRYTDVPAVCYLVAMTLHCCCLACFTWLFAYILLLGTEMRMTNIYSYRKRGRPLLRFKDTIKRNLKLRDIKNDSRTSLSQQRAKWRAAVKRVMTSGMYTVIGWGVPGCIVLLTVIWRYRDYMGNEYCWISSAYWIQLSFLVPIGGVFLVSWMFLIYVVHLYLLVKDDPSHRTLVAVTWSGLRSVTIINPLMSATWVLAAYIIIYKTILLQVIFAIVNVLLGITIFYSMCFMNEEIRLARAQKRAIGPAKNKKKKNGKLDIDPRFTPKTIEMETSMDDVMCGTGKCIHNSNCFYGQIGFEASHGDATPGGGKGKEEEKEEEEEAEAARSTPVTDVDIPKDLRKSKNRIMPAPKMLDLMSLAKKSKEEKEVREGMLRTAPARTDSAMRLLPPKKDSEEKMPDPAV